MQKTFTPDDRRRLAEMVGVHPATLYQALTAKGKGFGPVECVRIERESGKELMRWHLRPNDWFLIWPELVDAEGAPKPPSVKARAERATAKAKAAKGKNPDRDNGHKEGL